MKNIDLTKGRVMSVLLALALPIMGSSLLQFTYNIIDMFWIGHLGTHAVTSIGSSSFFINLGYSINALIMIGTGIKVSQCMGKGDEEGVYAYIRQGMQMSMIIGLIYGLALIVFGKSFIGFLKLNDQSVENNAYLYLLWSAPMLWFACLNQLFARIFASLGNSKSAFRISLLGIGLNIVLDPLFIYGFKWGIIGAAIATLLANVVMFFIYLIVGKNYVKFELWTKLEKPKIKEITGLGLPVACQRILFTVISILMAKLIATFGADAVGAQKIGVQIESVTYMVTGGLNGAAASRFIC